MTEKQRFGLIIALAALVSLALVGIVVSLLFAPAKVDQSPSLTVVLGLLVTSCGAIIAVIQNQGINAKTEKVAQAVNGGLEARLQSAVVAALAAHGISSAPATRSELAAVAPVDIDPHAGAGS